MRVRRPVAGGKEKRLMKAPEFPSDLACNVFEDDVWRAGGRGILLCELGCMQRL